MNLTKKFFAHFIAILSVIITPLLSYAGESTPFDRIVFFGDSLSDNGNLYGRDFQILPKSPPYFEGRFSNGDVWSDLVARHYENQKGILSSNYAFGGQTAIFHNPLKGFLPYTLTLAVDNYLFHNLFLDQSSTLFIIWIGANDYWYGAEDPEELSSAVTDKIKFVVERLIYFGGKNFLVVNMPNLSKTPYSRTNQMEEALNVLSKLHNKKLSAVVSDVTKYHEDVNIHLYDINRILMSFLANPDLFNRKYGTNVKHLKSACWQGGYLLRKERLSENMLERDIERSLRMNALKNNVRMDNKAFAPPVFSRFIASSPDLMETYRVSKGQEQGEVPCAYPAQYFFWDQIHPTAVVHNVLSKLFIAYIDKKFTHA